MGIEALCLVLERALRYHNPNQISLSKKNSVFFSINSNLSGTWYVLRRLNWLYGMISLKSIKYTASGVLLLLVQFFFAACDKDELTEPATLHLEAQATSTTAMDGLLVIDRLVLNISKLDVSGRRLAEGDMYFSRNLDAKSGNFEIWPEASAPTILQIPQGAYETLVFYTTLREEDYEFEYGSDDDDDETGDLQEYITYARPGLFLVGRYTHGAVTFPVVISLNDDIRRLAIDATQAGMPTVILQKEITALATLTLDPAYLFLSITSAQLEAAQAFPLENEQAVVISEEYNSTLYNQLAGRIQGAVTLTVENQ